MESSSTSTRTVRTQSQTNPNVNANRNGTIGTAPSIFITPPADNDSESRNVAVLDSQDQIHPVPQSLAAPGPLPPISPSSSTRQISQTVLSDTDVHDTSMNLFSNDVLMRSSLRDSGKDVLMGSTNEPNGMSNLRDSDSGKFSETVGLRDSGEV